MGMTYGSALITGAQIVDFTGVQDLANLATDSELVLNTFALSASDAIYRRLEGNGIDPSALTNENRLKDAVAYEAVKRLALAGYVEGDPTLFAAEVDSVMRSFRPQFSSGDEPRNATEGVPAVANFEAGWAFGPSASGPSTERFSDDFPTST